MPVRLKIKEKPKNKKFTEFLAMPKQTIKVGTNINYEVDEAYNDFDGYDLSNVLENGSVMRNIPGWHYNEKAFEKFKPTGETLFKTGVNDIINGSWDINLLLNKIGIEAATQYKNMIEEIKSPANAQKTIDKKGFDNPMIETGFFKFNISAEINGDRNVR